VRPPQTPARVVRASVLTPTRARIRPDRRPLKKNSSYCAGRSQHNQHQSPRRNQFVSFPSAIKIESLLIANRGHDFRISGPSRVMGCECWGTIRTKSSQLCCTTFFRSNHSALTDPRFELVLSQDHRRVVHPVLPPLFKNSPSRSRAASSATASNPCPYSGV